MQGNIRMKEEVHIKLGDRVAFDLIFRSGKREYLEFIIVDESIANPEARLLSCKSPLAQVILGEKVGSVIPYFTDELMAIQILTITLGPEFPLLYATREREERMREILSQIEFRDALLFASSSNSKWGNYDADGMNYQSWKNKSIAPDDEKI
jgi:hypothetical protein